MPTAGAAVPGGRLLRGSPPLLRHRCLHILGHRGILLWNVQLLQGGG